MKGSGGLRRKGKGREELGVEEKERVKGRGRVGFS